MEAVTTRRGEDTVDFMVKVDFLAAFCQTPYYLLINTPVLAAASTDGPEHYLTKLIARHVLRPILRSKDKGRRLQATRWLSELLAEFEHNVRFTADPGVRDLVAFAHLELVHYLASHKRMVRRWRYETSVAEQRDLLAVVVFTFGAMSDDAKKRLWR